MVRAERREHSRPILNRRDQHDTRSALHASCGALDFIRDDGHRPGSRRVSTLACGARRRIGTEPALGMSLSEGIGAPVRAPRPSSFRTIRLQGAGRRQTNGSMVFLHTSARSLTSAMPKSRPNTASHRNVAMGTIPDILPFHHTSDSCIFWELVAPTSDGSDG